MTHHVWVWRDLLPALRMAIFSDFVAIAALAFGRICGLNDRLFVEDMEKSAELGHAPEMQFDHACRYHQTGDFSGNAKQRRLARRAEERSRV